MTAIKTYLLRLILCGLLVSLAQTVLRGKKTGKAVALCGGCLLLLTAVKPLLQVDLSKLPDLVTGLTQADRQELAREKNDAILRRLVETQTAEWLYARAAELGVEASFTVEAEAVEEGVWVPRRVRASGVWTEQQRQTLARQIETELGIPAERQRWEVGG